ncbi:MAG TPA: hypothetical protein VIM30_13030 [Candidatus Limnocylindrales bacterium]|jgi:hypothetical protein
MCDPHHRRSRALKLGQVVSHREAQALVERAKLFEFVKGLVDAPKVKIATGSGRVVKGHIEAQLEAAGWACPVKIDPTQNTDLNALHQASRTVLQVQTGNIARAFYDLMKMQSLHQQNRAACGVLILPSATAARTIGGNLANFDRVQEELGTLYFHQVTIPVLLISFE